MIAALAAPTAAPAPMIAAPVAPTPAPAPMIAAPVAPTAVPAVTIAARAATTGDVFVEVPTATPKCGYDTSCAAVPLLRVDVVVTNPHPTEAQAVRLSFSRNFETRRSDYARSSPAAEITGLNAQLWGTSDLQATGIPVQLSKNWHSGSAAAFWCGFDGT